MSVNIQATGTSVYPAPDTWWLLRLAPGLAVEDGTHLWQFVFQRDKPVIRRVDVGVSLGWAPRHKVLLYKLSALFSAVALLE